MLARLAWCLSWLLLESEKCESQSEEKGASVTTKRSLIDNDNYMQYGPEAERVTFI